MKKTFNKYKVLNKLLLFFFILTFLVPVTGEIGHKFAALALLILGLVHTWIYRRCCFAVKVKKEVRKNDAE